MSRWYVLAFAAISMLAMGGTAWATPQYFPGTGHYYDVILRPDGLTWTQARAAAEGQVWQGRHGYLATITSAEESQFVFDLSPDSGPWYTDTSPPGSEARGYVVEIDASPTGVDPVTWGQIRSLFK